jgi:hypothetical protein
VSSQDSVSRYIRSFLAAVETGDLDTDQFEDDPRVPAIGNALALVGVQEVGPILGYGSYGMAAELPDGRVIKLTSDAAEVQIGAVLVGKSLPHVVRIDGSWFVRGARVRVTVGWDEVEQDVIQGDERIGVLLEERVQGLRRDDVESLRLNKIVRDFKDQHDFLSTLTMPPRQRRERLKGMAFELSQLLIRRNFEDVGQALEELAGVGVYAVDVHSGNIGYDAGGTMKVFDVGAGSPPPGTKTKVVGRAQKVAEAAVEQMIATEIGSAAEGHKCTKASATKIAQQIAGGGWQYVGDGAGVAPYRVGFYEVTIPEGPETGTRKRIPAKFSRDGQMILECPYTHELFLFSRAARSQDRLGGMAHAAEAVHEEGGLVWIEGRDNVWRAQGTGGTFAVNSGPRGDYAAWFLPRGGKPVSLGVHGTLGGAYGAARRFDPGTGQMAAEGCGCAEEGCAHRHPAGVPTTPCDDPQVAIVGVVAGEREEVFTVKTSRPVSKSERFHLEEEIGMRGTVFRTVPEGVFLKWQVGDARWAASIRTLLNKRGVGAAPAFDPQTGQPVAEQHTISGSHGRGGGGGGGARRSFYRQDVAPR